MWARLRRRTFAPSRPALYRFQYGLAAATAVAILAGIAVVVLAFAA